ncbi:LacI family DNA-binding transcriptional regulator [Paragemmobacter straminiformis]|uniref:LacI family DNA-binding transcriptional regulator n=1 Tax=Paragemmobacter straminiformis TaxID=2045119 RepID=A0A842I847_9RHOB|nr:LacI family DNA-binding transcriptional regulator [Gemmobacter straminiformis]MBC2835537.1 LacI family DNA-binding transcriptional regulator [Gemmobacter straminiformis]
MPDRFIDPAVQRPVTLKSIAKQLGVSVTTVARSLKDGHKISAETVRLVRETAEDLGYVRNLDGLRLRTGRTMSILAFLGASADDEIGDADSVGILAGIHRRLAGTDYTVRAVPVIPGVDILPELANAVRMRQADGVIIDHTRPQDERVDYLRESGMPFVTFGRTDTSTDHAFFDLDNHDAAFKSTRSLIDLGYKRIAIIGSDPSFRFVQDRLEGYRHALTAARLPFDPALALNVERQPRLIRAATSRLVAEARPDAFLCENELYLIPTIAGVRDAGAKPLDDYGFSLRSTNNLAEYLALRVTSAHYSRESAGWNLADLLLRQIGGAAPKCLQTIAKTDLRHFNL